MVRDRVAMEAIVFPGDLVTFPDFANQLIASGSLRNAIVCDQVTYSIATLLSVHHRPVGLGYDDVNIAMVTTSVFMIMNIITTVEFIQYTN